MTGFFTHPPRLRDIWRKIVLSTALGTTMAVVPAHAQQLSGPDMVDIFHLQPLNPPKAGPLTAQDRQDIAVNKALVGAAQKRFLALAKIGETPYAAELAATEARANAYIKVFGGSQGNRRVVFLDPYHLDIGMSLGLKEPEILRQLLAAEQVKNMPGREIKDIAAKFARRAPSILGYLTHTQEASAHNDGGVGVAVVVPTSDHALLFEIPGLTVAEQVELINTHEMWHTLNNRFNQTHAANEAVGAYLRTGDWPEFVKDNRAMFLYSQLIKSETLSDVAGVGDMIRAGYGMHILDRMRDKRAGNILDTQHMSVEALDALKAHLEKTGVENFRTLDDKAARDLYLKITEESGVSPGMLKFLYSWYDLPDDAARDAEKAKAGSNPDIRRGLAMLPYFPDLSAPPEPGG
ncbi:MAG TPA: hypothetical protein VEF76_11570, partial [Patescibacteria group bacterium]|nr:hypothetical protein [Patescibacteria group bacterium]